MANNKLDQKILQEFECSKAWGLYAGIDLKDCNPSSIRDQKTLLLFMESLCSLLNVKPHGKPVIEDFGNDERIAGYSLVQLIETSSISAHFVNNSNAAYIDIFSCKPYNVYRAAEFSKEFFKADSCHLNWNYRY